MKAEVEWIVGIIRCGKDFHQHGDAYDFSATLVKQDGKIEIVGASGNITPEAFKSMKREVTKLCPEDEIFWRRKTLNKEK